MNVDDTFNPADLAMFERLRIPVELLEAGGVRRFSHNQAIEEGIRYRSADLGGIWFPNFHPKDRRLRGGRLRRDHPERDSAGRTLAQYLSPPGRHHLYFPPGTGPLLSDPSIRSVIVESEKATLALTAAAHRSGLALLVIATGGCWGWRGVIGKTVTPSGGRVDEKGPLPDLDLVTWLNRDTLILFDANAATNPRVRDARCALAKELAKRGALIRIASLPVADGINGPDDFLDVHGDAALFELLDNALPIADAHSVRSEPRQTPPAGVIILPNDHVTYCDSARSVFTKLATTHRYFTRGGVVVELVHDHDGSSSLSALIPSALRSRLDREADDVLAYTVVRDRLILQPKRCSQSNAEVLINSLEARDLLPSIRLVSRSSIIVRGCNGPVALGPGYHDVAGGVLVTGTEMPPQVELNEAASALRKLLTDFEFPTPGDESRALAGMITPALVMGGWLPSRPPVEVAEADQSQAGKTYRHRLTRAIYNEHAYLITQREGGVGSLDESLSTALLSGRPFVALDNLRGRLDSRFLEAIVTWADKVPVRVPHRGEVLVDVSAVTFQLTSNGLEATRDAINRAVIVRIKKRSKEYKFQTWPEGDLLAHVHARSAYYLGCVFAVVRAWVDAGERMLPLSATGFHDFRDWAGILGWIVEQIFGMAPLLTGHEAAQARAANPALSWLRSICLAAEGAALLDQEWSASDFVELSDKVGLDLPGLHGPATENAARQHVGKLMVRCFQASKGPDRVALDGFDVYRTDTTAYNAERRREAAQRRYRIVRAVRPD